MRQFGTGGENPSGAGDDTDRQIRLKGENLGLEEAHHGTEQFKQNDHEQQIIEQLQAGDQQPSFIGGIDYEDKPAMGEDQHAEYKQAESRRDVAPAVEPFHPVQPLFEVEEVAHVFSPLIVNRVKSSRDPFHD